MGGIDLPATDWNAADDNPFFSADVNSLPLLEEKIKQLRRDGDSCGAVVEVVALSPPAGWGAPVFDRLDADIAAAMMSH